MIYGPSGCGKSSLVKAGLAAPALRADPPGLRRGDRRRHGARLLRAPKAAPTCRRTWGLPIRLSASGEAGPRARRSCSCIDQFEQWLHAHRSGEGGDLAASLKNCDGERVQAIVMVRVDFWMALTRFMITLEVQMRQDTNNTAIDLFGERHAREVLKLFGQAFGTLPDDPETMTIEQKSFVMKAVSQLSEPDGIAPVRLALFAQMIKEKDWSPEILREVGGSEGLGLRFLEDTFDSDRGRRKYSMAKKTWRLSKPCCGNYCRRVAGV